MKIIECPRDAMQGLPRLVPTDLKVAYLQELLSVGFDTIDFGSFVSAKAMPQMADTAEVLFSLDLSKTKSKLLAIVANMRGAEEALNFNQIDYLGYPLSLSETFQQRNTNRSIDAAMADLKLIQQQVKKKGKTLVVYLSMGFGNPYGDAYSVSMIEHFVERLDALGVEVISIADTVGVATSENIQDVFGLIIPKFPQIEFGAHLHSSPHSIAEKLEALYTTGCIRIDGAIGGFGGCPFADDKLIGNIDTEVIFRFLEQKCEAVSVDFEALKRAKEISQGIFI